MKKLWISYMISPFVPKRPQVLDGNPDTFTAPDGPRPAPPLLTGTLVAAGAMSVAKTEGLVEGKMDLNGASANLSSGEAKVLEGFGPSDRGFWWI